MDCSGLAALVVSIGLSTYLILRRPVLSESVIQKIEKVGLLKGLAGRADYLAQVLDDLYYHYVTNQKPMPYVLGINAVPEAITEHLDKELWNFRNQYTGYLGSMKATVPECDSALVTERFPCNGQEYPDVKRKIVAHAAVLRKLASDLLTSAKEEHEKDQQRII